jgi:adenylosuccinate synthase
MESYLLLSLVSISFHLWLRPSAHVSLNAAADLEQLSPERTVPQYTTLPGWESSIEKCKTYDELPANCKAYVEYIEKALGVPIVWIGVGPGRDSMITKPATLL